MCTLQNKNSCSVALVDFTEKGGQVYENGSGSMLDDMCEEDLGIVLFFFGSPSYFKITTCQHMIFWQV